jgi:hypothetical protein
MIFDSVDAFLASSTPLPPYIRKSRCLGQILITPIVILTKVSGFCPYCPRTGSYAAAWSEATLLSHYAAAPSDTYQTLLAHNLAGRRYCALFLERAGHVLGKGGYNEHHNGFHHQL